MNFTMTVMFEGRAIEINKDAGITHVNMGSLQLLGILNNHAETGLITEAARRGDLVNVSFAGKIAKGIKEAALYAILTTSPVIYGDLWARLRSCITMQVGQEEARRLAQAQWETKESLRRQAEQQFIAQERQRMAEINDQLRKDLAKEVAEFARQEFQKYVPKGPIETVPVQAPSMASGKEASGATVFDFMGQAVRIVMLNDSIWWVAKDVCDVLGLTNSRKALRALDEDEKGVTNSYTLGGKQTASIINESGMYKLIFKSRKEVAKAFTKWVTAEVLPTIRKKGYYLTDKKAADLLNNPITAYREVLAYAESLQTKNAMLEVKTEQLEAAGTEKDIEIRKLKARINVSADSEGLTITTLIAKQLEMTAIMLNRFLVWADVLFRKGGALVPCADYDGKNLGKLVSQPYESKDKLTGEVTTKTAYNWKWTGAGSNLIIEKWIDLRDAWKAAGCPGYSRTRKVKPTPEDK